MNRIELILHRRGRTGQIVYRIHLQQQRMSDIVPDKFKRRIAQQVFDILFGTGEKVVGADYIVSILNKTVA